jgi:hypothetical protein
MGTSGKAGNLRGKPSDGGNIFEGRRSTWRPRETPYVSTLFPLQNLSDLIAILLPRPPSLFRTQTPMVCRDRVVSSGLVA